MPNDFLSQEEIDILLGKKDKADSLAEDKPATADSSAPAGTPAAADPPAPAETPAAVDLPPPAETPAMADSVPAETPAAGDPPVITGASAAADLFAAAEQPDHVVPAPPEEEDTPLNLGAILEFPLQVSIRLGKASKTLQEIRKLNSGTVVELDCHVHETLDIYIGGKPIARGEVVLIEENFGIKITEIMDPVERVKKLR